MSTREDVISHLNQDVEKLLLELRSLGELKVAGERQGKAQLQGVQQRADQLEQDKQALQQASDGLQALVGQLRQVGTAFWWEGGTGQYPMYGDLLLLKPNAPSHMPSELPLCTLPTSAAVP